MAPDDPVDPVEPPAVPAAAAGGAAAEAGDGGQQGALGAEAAGAGVQMLSAEVKELQLNEPHKSAMAMFTPWHVVAMGLQIAGIPLPQSGQTRVLTNLQKAAALAGVGPLACKRPRRR